MSIKPLKNRMFRKEIRPEKDTANNLEHVFSFFILVIIKINNKQL